MLRIKLVKSPIGNNWRNRATIQALGLRKIRQVVEHDDTPTIRGMIHHVKHMLLVEEAPDAVKVAAKASAAKPKKAKPAKAEVVAEAKPVKAKAAVEADPKPARKPRAKKEEGEAE